jgi:hypothetical protein
MTRDMHGWKDEYLGEEKVAKDALRLPIAFADDWLFTDNRSDFSLGGHRLSSLYRNCDAALSSLINRYFAAFSSLKYSNSTHAGVTTPGVAR